MKVVKQIEGLSREEQLDVELAELLLKRKLPSDVVAAIIAARSHRDLATAVRRIAVGSSQGDPSGLELLSIAVAGDGFTTTRESLAGSLARVARHLAALSQGREPPEDDAD